MLKGKLGVVPEIAAYSVGSLIGLFVLARLLKTDAAQSLGGFPVIGAVVAGVQAVRDEAFS